MKGDVEQRRRAEASRKGVEVKRQGLALGFDAVGIATLEANAHAAELDRWLAAGYAGTMTYLHRQAEKRKDPARIMPDAKVAVVTLTNYFHGNADPGRKPGVVGVSRHSRQAPLRLDHVNRATGLNGAGNHLTSTRGPAHLERGGAARIPEAEVQGQVALGQIARLPVAHLEDSPSVG